MRIEDIEAKAYGIFETSETAQRKGVRDRQMASEMFTKGKVNIAKMSQAAYRGKVESLYLSLNNNHPESEKWEKEDIEKLPGKVFDEIFDKIRDMSGVDITEEEIKTFPED